MRRSQLIIVEGIWGAGKTSLMDNLHASYKARGVPVDTIYESDPRHPCFDSNFCSVEELIATATQRLNQIIDDRAASGAGVLLEAPILNSTLQHLILCNRPEDESAERALGIAQRFPPSHTKLIHLVHQDTEKSWQEICTIRGPGWVTHMERMLADWRALHELPFRNCLEFLLELRSQSDRVFRALAFPALEVDTSTGNWREHYCRIAEFLNLACIPCQPAIVRSPSC